MYSLLVKYSGWAEGQDSIPASRAFEYTDEAVKTRLAPNGQINFERVLRLPALFLQEKGSRNGDEVARVGTIYRATRYGNELRLEYVFDGAVPPLTNETIEGLSNDLEIGDFEFTRTHWAIKRADLFRALLRVAQPRRPRPRVFTIADPERIEASLVSIMMPFHPSFDEVHASLKAAAEASDLRPRRADDIWENPAVIQDVVSLIDRSKVVIADCTGRNPNVFYEIGIAHTLGREVVLITQNPEDVPFDLRHLRYVHYSNNPAGRRELVGKLTSRLRDLAGT